MGMSQSTTAKSAKRRRLHKRSIAVAFFVVLLPWILVAIPSTVVGLGGSTGSEIIHSVHGWPFVHFGNQNEMAKGDDVRVDDGRGL